MSYSVLILGAGRIGKTLAFLGQELMAKAFPEAPPLFVIADASADALLDDQLSGCETVRLERDQPFDDMVGYYKPNLLINALPHQLNGMAQRAAILNHVHYMDLTEDVEDTGRLIKNARDAGADDITLLPQQGLAPGLINLIGSMLVDEHTSNVKLNGWPQPWELRLRVGALPQVARNRLGYAATWSIDGLVNEYLQYAVEVVNHEIQVFPSLSGYERLNVRGVELEAFRTSGGVGSLPEQLKHVVRNINYKTLRWPGHHEVMMLLIEELKLDRGTLKQIFQRSVPSKAADFVYLIASLDMLTRDGQTETYEVVRRYTGLIANGKRFDAIQAVTALGALGVVELFWRGMPPGLIDPTMISYKEFEKTQAGILLNSITDVYLNSIR